MRSWDDALAAHGLVPAQALLVPHDFVDRRQYLHARRTLTRLLALGAVPIINENDAIASDEIRYGDNDRLAALVVAQPRRRPARAADRPRRPVHGRPAASTPPATLIAEVGVDDPLLSIAAGRGGSGRGSGGMASKLEAARIASWSGVPTVIANAARPGVLAAAAAGEPVGTRFEARRRSLAGAQAVDRLRRPLGGRDHRRRRRPPGARRAQEVPAARRRRRRSRGASSTATPSRCAASDGTPFARGMVFVDAAQLRKVMGMQTRDLPDGVVHEVIHRDDLVVLPA